MSIRNKIVKFFYKNFLKKLLFRNDPESVHDHMVKLGKHLGNHWITREFCSLIFNYKNPSLKQNINGIVFENPVGLSAGFDKNAELTDILPSIGFGFEEVGSITGEKCEGNPKPRLWRLKESKSLMVYYGLKNDGCDDIYKRLKNKEIKFPIGVSIAKTNSIETIDVNNGIQDYLKAYKVMYPIGDYFTINISCPNTFGGEPFTDPVKLDLLLTELDKANNGKPVFVKVSPDLTNSEIDSIIKVSENHLVDGFVCTNLTKNRDNKDIKDKNLPEKGGMSGNIVKDLSDNLIKYVYEKTKGKFTIIGVGGIFSAEDAYMKIKNGACLVQLITGMIYEGPELISEINMGLVNLLKVDGYTNISQAIGANINIKSNTN